MNLTAIRNKEDAYDRHVGTSMRPRPIVLNCYSTARYHNTAPKQSFTLSYFGVRSPKCTQILYRFVFSVHVCDLLRFCSCMPTLNSEGPNSSTLKTPFAFKQRSIMVEAPGSGNKSSLNRWEGMQITAGLRKPRFLYRQFPSLSIRIFKKLVFFFLALQSLAKESFSGQAVGQSSQVGALGLQYIPRREKAARSNPELE